jgi:transposase-like protein
MLGSIQLKLSDFGVEKPQFENVLNERFQTPETPRNVNKTLNLLIDNHFEYINPRCPICQSNNVIKQEFRERHPILGEFGSQKVYLRRYLCKDCGKKFITSLDSVIKPHYRYANVFMDKLKLFIETGHRSLRKSSADYKTFFNVSPSHTSMMNWQTKDVGNRIENLKADYSGYYSCDEQWIKLNGHWHYRLTLYDYILNIPIAEEITPNKGYDTIKEFIRLTTADKEFYSLTTDGLLDYKGITEDLGVIHQLCIFHLLKTIKTEIYTILRSYNISEEDKMNLRYYFHEIKHIFDTNVEEIATQRLERLLDKFNNIPKFLQKFIKNKIVPDFQRLTQFTRNHNIPRTTSCNENYYRQTLPDELKRKYKTTNGIINYLLKQMENWTGKHRKNTNTH